MFYQQYNLYISNITDLQSAVEGKILLSAAFFAAIFINVGIAQFELVKIHLNK